MKTKFCAFVLCLALATANAADLPQPIVPDCIGVCLHPEQNPTAQDFELLQAAGVGFVRIDFLWSEIQPHDGNPPDFRFFDTLVAQLAAHNIRIYGLLCYGNQDHPPTSFHSQEFRDAFAKYVTATASHFRGKAITWELWNEPNNAGPFWPSADPNEYMAMAKQALPAIRAADPTAPIVAPACGPLANAGWKGIGWEGYRNYMTACFDHGLLKMIDGVSVHPYRGETPETVATAAASNYAQIRSWLPAGSTTPVISGEWGYSVGDWGATDSSGNVITTTPQLQADYVARMMLVNMSQGVPLSVWYDWKDDGTDPKEPEHHFGLVGADLVPKPAYHALKALTYALRGKAFGTRLDNGNPNDWLLVFQSADGHATLAAWTIAGDGHVADVPGWGKLHLTGAPAYVNRISPAR